MGDFWLSLVMVFLAELGDKTQLVALCFATRFRAGTVLAGVFAATFVVHLFSVALGKGAGSLLPAAYVSILAGLAFIGFGYWTLQGDSLDDDACLNKHGRSAFWIVASTFFLAELGDKTMLSTVTLATDNAAIPVWIGSSLGMVVSDGLAIGVGRLMGSNLPQRMVKVGAASVFFAFGAWKCFEGFRQTPPVLWAIAGTTLAVLTFVLVAASRARKRRAAAGMMLDELCSPIAEALEEETLSRK